MEHPGVGSGKIGGYVELRVRSCNIAIKEKELSYSRAQE